MEPTQVERPWMTTVRTVFQMLLGLIALVALIKVDAGYPAAIATAVAVSATVTRVMAMPEVNFFIDLYIPWLSVEVK